MPVTITVTLHTLIVTSIAFVVLIAGVMVVDQTRADEALNDSLGGNSTAPYTPPNYANNTLLEQECFEACAGGACNQSAVSGITLCTSCPSEFTINPDTQRCGNGTRCASWPWCSTQQAQLLLSTHHSVAQLGVSRNYSLLDSSTEAHLVDDLVPALAPDAQQALQRANLYFTAKKQLIANSTSLEPSRYWDDEGVSSDTLSTYISHLEPRYAAYVTPYKLYACSRTWIPGKGDCVPPM